MSKFLEMIKARTPVIYDGATGTEIQKHEYSIDDIWGKRGCNELLNITRPEILRSIHKSYFDAGAHIVESNTFGGNRAKLAEFGVEDHLVEINTAAVRIAREAAEEAGLTDGLVSGSMGPTGFILSSTSSSLASISFDECAAIFEEQAFALAQAGADVLLLETMQDLLEVRAGLIGCRRALKRLGKFVPLQVQVTMDQTGHMLLGSDVSAFLGAVVNCAPDVIGFNCSTGPAEMDIFASAVLDSCDIPVSMVPNAGMPENVDGKAHYHMMPEPFAKYTAAMATEKGVAVVGGCCGTSPAHIAALAKELAGKTVAKRESKRLVCFLSTGISGRELNAEKSPFVVGERLNAQGSKKTKELVLAENYDELHHVALEQIDKGAVLIDCCVAVNERDDEADVMKRLTRHLSERISVPLCIDSTDPAVFEAALRMSPGSVLINSINLEHNGDKARRILPLAKEFGCPVIALPIDNEGMARTVERKVELVGKIVDLACGEFGLPLHFLYVDPLVFTLATGDPETAGAALDSFEALRQIKAKWPSIHTAMGVSNVSFGLSPAARRVLNNLMIHHAGIAGLDAAIFNPLHLDAYDSIDPKVRELGENLLFNRKETALAEYVAYFEELAASKKPATAVIASKILSPEEELAQRVLKRDRRDLAAVIAKLLETTAPLDILNKILLPAMAEVGERMARGEMILPFVLQAAEIMKESVAILEPHFDKGAHAAKGIMLIATVYGDVHDIGKNLVASIIRNQGWDVIDLGKQVPLDKIVEAVEQYKPAAVGLSALLVTTSREMAAAVHEFANRNWTIPLIIGGAAVNPAYGERIAKLPDGSNYAGNVYYARDAFDAIKVLEGRAEPAHARVYPSVKRVIVPAEPLEHNDILEPPFWGTSEMLVWDSAELLRGLNREELYNAWWKAGRLEGAARDAAFEEFDDVYDNIVSEIMNGDLLEARGFYGFFPVITDDTKLIVLDPANNGKELASFDFPRVERAGGRSYADFFRPEGDLLAMQFVTAGAGIGRRCTKIFEENGEYSKGFYLNAIAGYIAEELADKVNAEISKALLLDKNRGKRMSFGFGGLPDTTAHKELFALCSAEERLGIELTEGGEMNPEHSTAAIFVHHPKVIYLS